MQKSNISYAVDRKDDSNKRTLLRHITRSDDDDVVFRKEWYRKTGKEVMEGRPLLHRLLGFKSRCKGCLKLIIMMLF
jgi:hypothetical protein